MPLNRPEDFFQLFINNMVQPLSEDMLQHSMNEINQKTKDGIVFFSSFAYFSSDNIPIDVIMTEMSSTDLKIVLEIAKKFMILNAHNDNNFVSINKQAQKDFLASIENSGGEKETLKFVNDLLIKIGRSADKFHLLTDHAVCVWFHTHNYDDLLKVSCVLPSYILTSLIKQYKFKRANLFGWKALKLLKAVIGNNHIEVLKLQFQLADLLELTGKYKSALRLLMPLFNMAIKDTELNTKVKLAVISVIKKLQDMSKFDEILPVYEKLLSNVKVEETKDEAILKAWHHYALLLLKLDRSEDFVEISNDILKRTKIPLEIETKFYFLNNMANAFLEQPNYLKALASFRELLEEQKLEFGENHAEILNTKYNIATVLQKLSNQIEYIATLEEVVKQYEEVVGKNHPETISIKAELALAYYKQKECKKAAELFKNVSECQKDLLLQNGNEIFSVKQNLSSILVGDELHPDQIRKLMKEMNENSVLIPASILEMKKNIEILSLTDSASILSMAKDSDVGKVYEVLQNGIGVNISDDDGNTPLHYASQFGNTAVVKLLLDFGAAYAVKNKQNKTPVQVASNNNTQVLLYTVEKLFRFVKSGNYVEVKNCIQKHRCIVNSKDGEGYHPLHWAVSNGHISILKLLLEAGADPTYVTNKGNTPLHTAASKGLLAITEVLLQFVKCDEFDNFINAQTQGTGATSLHVAAKKGFKDIMKALLKYGAIYNVKNNEDKTPLELFEDKASDNILKLVKDLFEDAEKGTTSITEKMKKVSTTDLSSIANACNIQGSTLVQVLINNNHKKLAFECLQVLKNLHSLKPWKSFPKTVPGTKNSKSPEQLHLDGTLQQIESFLSLAKLHLVFADPFILNLQYFCNLSSHLSEINPSPPRTYGDGILYLHNVQNLVKEYKKSYPNWTENVNIVQINDALQYLEFESEPVPGEPGSFMVKRTESKFRNLLHSELKKDLRLFIDLVEINIEIPVIRFLHSLTSQICSFYSEALFKAIETNDRLSVEKYIKEDRAVLNITAKGTSPLHYAINNASFKIVKLLIENGANTIQEINGGDTLLHLSASKGHKGSVELLLKHTYPDKLNKFIDAKNKADGDTALHLAAKNGYIIILKSLLKYGACYCAKNKQGKVPLDLVTKSSNIKDLLKLISQLFQYAQSESFEFAHIIRSVNREDVMSVTNARNDLGQSLLDVIKMNHFHRIPDLPDHMLDMMINYGTTALYHPIQYDQTSHETIYRVAKTFSEYSDLYLAKLRYKAQVYPDDVNKNPSPWSTLKEGSFYLNNVSRFVEECKSCVGEVNNTNFLKIKETLAELQFDPAHITSGYRSEVHGGKIKSFVSKGQGSAYYKLLYSEMKRDVLQFIMIVEKGIETPAIRFLGELKCLVITAQPGIF